MSATYTRRIAFHESLCNVRLVLEHSNSVDTLQSTATQATPGDQSSSRADERMLASYEAVKDLLNGINEGIQELEENRRRSLRELQQVAIDLAICVSSQILQREVAANEYPIEKFVQMAVERLDSCQRLVFRLHPQDLEQFQRVLADAKLDWSLPDGVELVADASQTRGACFADAGDFGLLSTLDQQLDDLQRILKEGLKDAQIERRAPRAPGQEIGRFPDRRETA